MKKYLLILLVLTSTMLMAGCQEDKNPPKKVTFTVTFISDGIVYDTKKVESGNVVTKPLNDPTKTGYNFDYWTLDGREYLFSSIVTSDLTLFATFTKQTRIVELLDDTSFSNGFALKGVSTTMGSTIVRNLTADNVDAKPNWQMAQWWTKYDMQYADYEKVNGVHIYSNESHEVRIDNQNNSLYMKLLASKEYDHPREAGENWPHILIEQNCQNPVFVSTVSKVVVSLDFKIIRADNMMDPTEYNAGNHAAQFLWYFTLQNITTENSNPEEVGTYGDFLWFGVPLYDSRHPNGIDEYKHVDSGFVGATNKLIYGMSNKTYLDLPLEMNKEYHIELDILPYLKEAFIYGKMNGALENAQWGNMRLGYMNFGWELPGTFDVESEIRNISTKIHYE